MPNATILSRFLIGAMIALGGCASAGSLSSGTVPEAPLSTGSTGGYALSASEKELSCKQLAGRMQVRILEIRDYNARMQSSGFSNLVQTAVSSTIGGPTRGTNPSGAYARDVAMLEAYNAELARKGCKSYDLAAELQPKDVRETPTAHIKPASEAH